MKHTLAYLGSKGIQPTITNDNTIIEKENYYIIT